MEFYLKYQTVKQSQGEFKSSWLQLVASFSDAVGEYYLVVEVVVKVR
jgi:hypothetical protein